MAECAIGEARLDEPAMGAELLGEARLDLRDLAAEIARGVDEMAAMGEHIVAPEIRLGIARGLLRLLARDGERLHRVGHRVAMGRIAIPGLEGENLPDFLPDERMRRLQSGVEALH